VALPKLVCERIARSFASRTGADIYALRIGVVIEPADYGRFPAALADPLSRKRDAWSYIDVRDLARILDLCLEKDGLGFQVFNATNDEIIANEPTTSSLTKHAPRTPMPANSRGSRLRCPIERRGSFWASASRTTGENVVPVVIDRQPRPADHRCAAACGTFGSRIDAASRSGLHSACGQPGDDIALSQKEYQDRR
jgi:hypothetical protein